MTDRKSKKDSRSERETENKPKDTGVNTVANFTSAMKNGYVCVRVCAFSCMYLYQL